MPTIFVPIETRVNPFSTAFFTAKPVPAVIIPATPAVTGLIANYLAYHPT